MSNLTGGRAGKIASILTLGLLLTSLVSADEPAIEAIVLCYHVVQSPTDSVYSIDRSTFREQMQYLATTGYNIIPLAELLDYVEGRRDSLPPNPVVITVDDGWRCTYTEIYPELQKLNFPFTVFIYPKFIQRTRNPYALTWDEVREMSEAGVDIQSHSYSHPFLTHRRQITLSGEEYGGWLQDELIRSKQAIEKEIGKPVRFLAYPYGDYDTRVARGVKRAGYDAALTCDYGPVRRGSDPFRMRRVSMYKDTTFATFREHLGGGGLRLNVITPEPGDSFDPKNPVVEARIDNFEKLDPESVRMTLLSLGQTPYSYNPENGSISLVVREKLKKSAHRVVVWGLEKETGRRLEASWSFHVGSREPAVSASSDKPAKPAVVSTSSGGTAPVGQRRR